MKNRITQFIFTLQKSNNGEYDNDFSLFKEEK